MEIKNIPEILERELPEIIKKIALDKEILPYIENPNFLDERVYSWHEFGLLEHTQKVRQVFLNELDNFLKELGIKEKVDEILNLKIDDIEKRILFEISIPLHDLGKIPVYKDERKDRAHEMVSKQLIEQRFLKEKLKEFGLTENHLNYIGKLIETHDVLGKQLRDILKHQDKLRLDYINENPEEIKDLCQDIINKYVEIKTEIGLFYFCDSLGKTSMHLDVKNDKETVEQESKIEQDLKDKNLPHQLKKAILQLPVNMKLAEVYFKVV